MQVVCETDRLFLGELRETDSPFILRLLNTPDWLRHIGDRNVRTMEDARRYIAHGVMTSYKERGYGAWLVVRKQDGEPIGLCGLFRREFLAMPDLGFALVPEAMGCGYAFEASKAVIGLANGRLGFDRLAAIVSPGNHRSVRLLEKLGFGMEGETESEGAKLLLYTQVLGGNLADGAREG